MKIEYNYKIKNSFKLNSVADICWLPENKGDLIELSPLLNTIPIIAEGTNIICKEKIKEIICLRLIPKYITVHNNILRVGAGTLLQELVLYTIDNNFSGFEGLYGIPGQIGSAIYGNVGSGKYCISDNLRAVSVIDSNGNFKTYLKEDLQFRRRYSILQEKNEIIIEALFDISKGNINIEELKKSEEHRKSLPKYPSAGGFWKNWHTLKPYSNQLIGLRVGGAEVSDKINIIINKGNATFYDIESLINKIRSIVKESLQLEIRIIG